MAEATRILDTSWELFSQWLESHTFHVATRHQFPLPEGYVVLHVARRSGRNAIGFTVDMLARYHVPNTAGQYEEVYDWGEGIRFTLIPLASERVEVKMECDRPVFYDYANSLLDDIDRRWPAHNAPTPKDPEPKPKAEPDKVKGMPLGAHGSTMERVKEARALVEQGTPKRSLRRRCSASCSSRRGWQQTGRCSRTGGSWWQRAWQLK